MKVTARLPVYVRGHPVRNNGPRDVFVSRDVQWRIPEISRSEAELAFESFDAFRSIVDGSDPLKRPIAYERVPHRVDAISYAGELYRRISRDGENIRQLFSRAFPPGYVHESDDGVCSEISVAPPVYSSPATQESEHWEDRISRPISLPVFKHMQWQMRCRSTSDTTVQNQEIWPQSIPNGRGEGGMYGARNAVSFEEILPKLLQYDHDQLEDCTKTHHRHLSSFLLVDGQLWMKTRPPVYRVHRRFESTARTSAVVSLCFPPDWQDPRLVNAYFSLASREEAFEYARRLCGVLARRQPVLDAPVQMGAVHDSICNHVVHDEAIMRYECEAEELRRMSSALAVETRRFLVRNPTWKEKFDPAAVAGVYSGYEQVRATNYIKGEYGDPSDWLHQTAFIWKKAGRKTSIYDFGDVPTSDMLIGRAMRYEENKPISVNAVHLSTSATKRNWP